MTCDELSHRLPEYWANELPDAARRDLERHLAACAACREEVESLGTLWQSLGELRVPEPPAALARRVSDVLVREIDAESGERQVTTRVAPSRPRPWFLHPAWGVAAGLLVAVLGFATGRSWPDAARQAELAELRGEIRGMRQMVAVTLLQQASAADRLRGVTWSAGLDRPGSEVVSALLETLRRDANVNVRLASIDALKQLGGGELRVRTALVDGLKSDASPLVQLALIDAIVSLGERRSADTLRALADNPSANEAVRQRARRGLRQLL
jgi:anti-sigma factor RsiW